MSIEPASGFFVLPFGMDGESVGFGFWADSQLSESLLGICKDFLASQGSSFDAPWKGNLSHITTKMTSASGASLATFSAHGKAVLSVLLLSGKSPAADDSVAQMFAESLKRTPSVRAASQSANPFGEIFGTNDRPLMAVVAWPEATIAERDHALVRNLGLHLAGAFFACGRAINE